MARGWESKSVEDQIASADERRATVKPAMSPDAIERESRRAGLALSRAKIVRDLENARDQRHRTILQQALDYLDAEMEGL
jgi:hypothetical protein